LAYEPGRVLPAFQFVDSGMVAGSGLLLLAVCGLTVWRARKQPYLLVGWCWFLGVLLPFIGLVQAGAQAMADRFAYLPLIGLLVMLLWGVQGASLAGTGQGRSVQASPGCHGGLPGALASSNWVLEKR